jgi:NADH-quinone oxidoreductase subunit H
MLESIRNILATQFGFSVVWIILCLLVILTAVAYCIYFERKIAAWMQDRFGPNRVGPYGLLQPLADGLKFVLKEEMIPARVDRPLFFLAPMLAFVLALIGFVILPFGGRIQWPWMAPGQTIEVQGASIDIGLLYLIAIGSMGVYGVVLGGWASNNKYAFYGAMRSAAQMLSYEVPMGLAILTVILTSGVLRLEDIVTSQVSHAWNLLLHPVAFLLLLTTALAETNRAPFDLAEAEQELIGGYHTEYSSMKFALFFLAEYAHMITAGGLMVALFLGGYEPLPFTRLLADVRGLGWLHWIATSPAPFAGLLRVGVFAGKIAFVIFLFMWIRWTLPRFRFDQLMRLAWKGLVPVGMAVVVVQGVMLYAGRPVSWFTPLIEIGLLALAALIGVASGAPITGRQTSMTAEFGTRNAELEPAIRGPQSAIPSTNASVATT